MNATRVASGMGNEAIKVGFWHAVEENNTNPNSHVLLIGNMPPNTLEEVGGNRSEIGEAYWQTTKFKQVTDYNTPLDPLISHGVPVHAFYVDRSAQAAFAEIATRSGGSHGYLDLNAVAAKAVDLLTHAVSISVLHGIGGHELSDRYSSKYGRGYV